MYPESVAEKLRDPALFCSSVLLLLIDNFGAEVVNWEPESIHMEVEDVFKVEGTRLLADKINASTALLASDLYHKSLEAFTSINSVFNFKTVSSVDFNYNSTDDIMWGLTEARLLEGPEIFDKAGFSHDIAGYTANLLSSEGLTKPPRIMSFAEYDPNELDRRGIVLSGDAAAAEVYWSRQEEARGKLEEMALTTLKSLIDEVRGLPLKNGKDDLPESFK